MSFETITITRQLPIINGFVQLPNNLEKNKSAVSLNDAVTENPNIAISSLTAKTGGARLAGGKFGVQEWLELTETIACCNIDDAVEDLKDLQSNNSTVPNNDRPPPGEGEWNEI